jgi:hypothetical protein
VDSSAGARLAIKATATAVAHIAPLVLAFNAVTLCGYVHLPLFNYTLERLE